MDDLKKEALEEGIALMEMYKAGFLDGYRVFGRTRSKAEFEELNKKYQKAFRKRFMKKVLKRLKSKNK